MGIYDSVRLCALGADSRIARVDPERGRPMPTEAGQRAPRRRLRNPEPVSRRSLPAGTSGIARDRPDHLASGAVRTDEHRVRHLVPLNLFASNKFDCAAAECTGPATGSSTATRPTSIAERRQHRSANTLLLSAIGFRDRRRLAPDDVLAAEHPQTAWLCELQRLGDGADPRAMRSVQSVEPGAAIQSPVVAKPRGAIHAILGFSADRRHGTARSLH